MTDHERAHHDDDGQATAGARPWNTFLHPGLGCGRVVENGVHQGSRNQTVSAEMHLRDVLQTAHRLADWAFSAHVVNVPLIADADYLWHIPQHPKLR